MRRLGELLSASLDRVRRASRRSSTPLDGGRQPRSDGEIPGLALYVYPTCPYCTRVRRVVKRLGLRIERRNVLTSLRRARELRHEGGKLQVPCLRIGEEGGVRWLYESADIIRYLEGRFGSR